MTTRKIVSWDVGIKNLAYCVFEYYIKDIDDKKEIDRDENGCVKFTIKDWDIVNLIESENPYKCLICGKKGKFIGNNEIYCGIHKNKYVNIFDESCILKKLDKPEICIKSGKKAYYSIKHKNDEMFLSSSFKNSMLKRIKKSYELQKIPKSKSANKTNVMELCESMATKLDKIESLKNVDEVVIENQPSLKNPMMKTVASFLASYFVIRGKVDSNKIDLVKFMSPSNKLKINKDKTAEVINKNIDAKYKLTKQLGIEYTNILLEGNEWLNHLSKYKKKDDLCDALLQGYYFVNHKL